MSVCMVVASTSRTMAYVVSVPFGFCRSHDISHGRFRRSANMSRGQHSYNGRV